MPFLAITTNQKLTGSQRSTLMQVLSAEVAKLLGKSEQYIMVTVKDDVPMSFGGDSAPAAYVVLKSIGLAETELANLSQQICDLLDHHLQVPKSRVYIEFAAVPRAWWGWDGRTF